MPNNMLLPTAFRKAGLVLLLFSTLLLVAWSRWDFTFAFLDTAPLHPDGSISGLFEDNNLTNEVLMLGLLCGLIFIAFAREKQEDERVTLIRLQSLQLSHYISYLLFITGMLLINGISFLLCLLYLPFLFLIIFILVFYCRLYLLPKFAVDEK